MAKYLILGEHGPVVIDASDFEDASYYADRHYSDAIIKLLESEKTNES